MVSQGEGAKNLARAIEEESTDGSLFPLRKIREFFSEIMIEKGGESMTKAEKAMLSGVDPVMKDQAVTVCRIERAFRAKVKELIPIFKEAEATQTVTNTQGEKVLKSNPAMQEIRATFRDYCTIVKVQQDILASKTAPVEVTSISALRSKLKIAK